MGSSWTFASPKTLTGEPPVFKGYADAYKGQKAQECLSGRGYVVVDIPRMVDQNRPTR